MTSRFDIRKDDHPEGNRWSVFDMRTGEVALVDGVPQRALPQDDADELLAALNLPDETVPERRRA